MATIGVWVKDDVKEAWKILNKVTDGKATEWLKHELYRILADNKDVIIKYKKAETEEDRLGIMLEALASVKQEEIVLETTL